MQEQVRVGDRDELERGRGQPDASSETERKTCPSRSTRLFWGALKQLPCAHSRPPVPAAPHNRPPSSSRTFADRPRACTGLHMRLTTAVLRDASCARARGLPEASCRLGREQ